MFYQNWYHLFSKKKKKQQQYSIVNHSNYRSLIASKPQQHIISNRQELKPNGNRSHNLPPKQLNQLSSMKTLKKKTSVNHILFPTVKKNKKTPIHPVVHVASKHSIKVMNISNRSPRTHCSGDGANLPRLRDNYNKFAHENIVPFPVLQLPKCQRTK